MNWKQWTAAAVGSGATLAALAWYLLGEEKRRSEEGDVGSSRRGVSDITLKEVLNILEEIQASQDVMKEVVRGLTAEILEKDYDFETLYGRVVETRPGDPLDKYGLTMEEFDKILDKNYQHQEVRDLVVTIMRGGTQPRDMPPEARATSAATIVQIHQDMVADLTKIVTHIAKKPKEPRDTKCLTVAVQTYVGAKCQAKYGLSPEDIEACIIAHTEELTTDSDFSRVNLEIQSLMQAIDA